MKSGAFLVRAYGATWKPSITLPRGTMKISAGGKPGNQPLIALLPGLS